MMMMMGAVADRPSQINVYLEGSECNGCRERSGGCYFSCGRMRRPLRPRLRVPWDLPQLSDQLWTDLSFVENKAVNMGKRTVVNMWSPHPTANA